LVEAAKVSCNADRRELLETAFARVSSGKMLVMALRSALLAAAWKTAPDRLEGRGLEPFVSWSLWELIGSAFLAPA
jgi:hypothetical protein